MNEIKLNRGYKKIHFIGIGGINMNTLAQILSIRGFIVSGSDEKRTEITDVLEKKGIKVFIGHKKENVAEDTDLVVYTVAVKADNVEFISAKEKGIEMIDRANMLGQIMKNYKNPVCVAGTHGKTTTTSMISDVFLSSEKNPTILVGGHLNSINGTLKDGGNEFFFVESCEYYNSFLSFFPKVAIILNLEADHLDFFKDLEDVRKSFKSFAEIPDENGFVVINNQIENYSEIVKNSKAKVITFGLTGADITASNISFDSKGLPTFDVSFQGEITKSVKLSVVGVHNITNSLAVWASSKMLGLTNDEIKEGLKTFYGARRRLEYKGDVNGITIIDDYAHHPTEIITSIKSLKNKSHNKLWVVFQPHTHSRTKTLLNEFASCFDGADEIVFLDIYSPAGREEKSTHIHSKEVVELIKARGNNVQYVESFEKAKQFLLENAQKDDIIVTMGAGDVTEISDMLIKTTN